MARITWKENKIISIETRKRLFVLAQMIQNPYLIIFDKFSFDDKWENIDLNAIPILLCAPVTKQFLSNSFISTQKNIKPQINMQIPNYWIHKDVTGFREISLWEGTENNISISLLGNGEGELIEKDITKQGSQQNVKLKQMITSADKGIIDKYEITNVRTYPELNERIYLCYKYGKNVDPLKELSFDQEIPLEYHVYCEILSGQMDKEKWESLSI